MTRPIPHKQLLGGGVAELRDLSPGEIFPKPPAHAPSPREDFWPESRLSFLVEDSISAVVFDFARGFLDVGAFRAGCQELEARLRGIGCESYCYSLPRHGGKADNIVSSYLLDEGTALRRTAWPVHLDVICVVPLAEPLPLGKAGYGFDEICQRLQREFDPLCDAAPVPPVRAIVPPLGSQSGALWFTAKGERVPLKRLLDDDRRQARRHVLEGLIANETADLEALQSKIAGLKAELSALGA